MGLHVQARSHQAGDVGHVHQQVSAHFFGDLGENYRNRMLAGIGGLAPAMIILGLCSLARARTSS